MGKKLSRQLGMVCARAEHLLRLEELGLRRFELVILDRESEETARRFAADADYTFSIHAPLFRDAEYHEYALMAALVDPDPSRCESSLALMRRELYQAAEWGAKHVVAHLQRNLLMNGENAPHQPGQDGVDIAIEMVGRLMETARELQMPVHFENMMGSPIFHSPQAYANLCRAIPDAKLCLDLGHFALDALHFGFDMLEGAQILAPYLGSLHVYNNQIDEFDFASLRESGLLRKIPVHPSQSPGHDWIPVGRMLRAILGINPKVLLTFEVYFRLEVSPEQTLEGIEWVSEILDEMRCQTW